MEILKHEGKPAFVVMPYDEYQALVKKLEDIEDNRDYREARAAIESGQDELIPDAMVNRLLEENPVKVWREYRGLKQKELAERAGVKASMLSQIESGNKQGSMDTMKRLAEALKVDLDDLI